MAGLGLTAIPALSLAPIPIPSMCPVVSHRYFDVLCLGENLSFGDGEKWAIESDGAGDVLW